MKKIVLSTLMAVASSSAFSVDLGLDNICANNGDFEGAVDYRGERYVKCVLPSSINVEGTIKLPSSFTRNDRTVPILWVMDSVVVVGDGQAADATPASVTNVTLQIEAGTQLVAEKDVQNAGLVVTRGSQLLAIGTAKEPIVFASMTDEDFVGKSNFEQSNGVQAEWGGVVLSGFGVSNECNGQQGTTDTCLIEGISEDEFYFGGGLDTSSSSGNLSYVVIAETGYSAAPDSELNGLTLYATNSSTSLNNVHVHYGTDDGIEFFGGTTSASNLILTCNQDDSIDWDHGFSGVINGAYIEQNAGSDHAFELAGNPANKPALGNPLAQPLAIASVNNVTVRYSIFNEETGKNTDVPFKIKEGTTANFNNVVVKQLDSSEEPILCDKVDSVSTLNATQVSYDCKNNGDMPASDRNATGYTAGIFWEDYPGCN